MKLLDRVRRVLHGERGLEWSDRYGGQWPDADMVCPGPCEGMGVFPAYSPRYDQRRNGTDPQAMVDVDDTALIEAAGATPDDDGWAFLTCPECDGSGRRVVA